MSDQNQHESIADRLEVAGQRLTQTVSDLLAQGNVRTLTIRSPKGDLVLSVPLTAGALVGGAFVLAAPWLAILAAIAGVLAEARIEVTYDESKGQAGAATEGSSGESSTAGDAE